MSKDKLPEQYIQWLPRVSQIVESFYPFLWEARDRFLQWLEMKNISFSEYMEEASSWWRYIHSKLEQYVLTGATRPRKYKTYVEAGIQFLKDFNVKPIATEKYVRCKDYQWTIDLIGEIDGKKYILDYKSYWMAKDRYWLGSKEYRKPYSKLKKARLQLSLYARVEKIKHIGIIELLIDGYHFHELKLIPNKELDTMILEFKNNYIDQL